ncbi:MAG: MoxR family ATPase [Actinobacteria bacterium]|nr:MoxR family ATPase [Actinomycetota bacterium]
MRRSPGSGAAPAQPRHHVVRVDAGGPVAAVHRDDPKFQIPRGRQGKVGPTSPPPGLGEPNDLADRGRPQRRATNHGAERIHDPRLLGHGARLVPDDISVCSSPTEEDPVTTIPTEPPTIAGHDEFAARCNAIAENVERVIVGKRSLIDLALVCLLARGHLLIEDVPGVGKTTLAKALARSIGGTFGRIQFTPDLLPGDVVGVAVWNRNTAAFEFRPGPIFANVVIADEVNRAAPKTQSALLEAMAERQVTVDGTTYALPSPFVVLATENPVEHEGTYPLPESQLDRFCMRLSVGYPDLGDEVELLARDPDADVVAALGAVMSTEDMARLSSAVDGVRVADSLRRHIVEIARATRDHPAVAIGMSPRATLTLQHVARARAALRGRDYLTPDDVRDVLVPVVAHRLILTPDARIRGITAHRVLAEIVERLPVPTGVRPIA